MKSNLAKINASLIGSLAVALGINLFLVPYQLLDGGMIGIGLLIHYFFGVNPGISILTISLPIFISVYFINRELFFHSLYGLLVSSVFIDLLTPLYNIVCLPLPLHAMYGGSLIGIGIGIMLAYGMNTGGTDLLALMLSNKLHIPVAVLIFIIDFLILIAGVHVIGLERVLYSLIVIFFVALFTYFFSAVKIFGT